MCLAQAEEFTGRVRNTRDNVNDLFGWNQKDPTPPTVNVYNTLPSGDIRPSGEIRRAGDFGQKGDVNTYPNRSSLQSGKK